MNTIRISKRTPLPLPFKAKYKWPWIKLEVGESFLCPIVGPEELVLASMRAQVCNNSRKFQPKKFVCRLEAGGIRVWRTE